MILAPPHADHLPAYLAYCTGPRSGFVGGPYTPVQAFDKFCAMAGHWVMRGFGRYVITLRETGRAIGHVGALQIDTDTGPEMTWTLWEDAAEGQGHASEAARAYLGHAAAALPFDHLLVRIDAGNVRSLKLAERLGAVPDDNAKPPAWMPGAVTFRIALRR